MITNYPRYVQDGFIQFEFKENITMVYLIYQAT